MYYEVESNADNRQVRIVAENPRTAVLACIRKHGIRHKITVRRVSVDLGTHTPTVHCERHGYPREFMRALAEAAF